MAEQNSSSVEILSSEPTIRNQYGRGFVYANNRKYPLWVLATGIVLFFSLILPLVQSGPPKSSEIALIANPSLDHLSVGNINIPLYSIEQIQNEKARQLSKQKAKINIKYPGIQSFEKIGTVQIPQGIEVRAKVKSTATDGLVLTELVDDLFLNGSVIFKSGTLFTGQAVSRHERLQISFSSALVNGKKVSLQAQALDIGDKKIGIRAPRFQSYTKKMGNAIGLSFLAGAADVLQDRDMIGTNVVKRPTLKNAVINGINQSVSELSRVEMEKVKDAAEGVVIDIETEFIIAF